MRALIFDLDGTLLNTLGDIGNACNAILEKYHYPLHSRDAYRRMVGNGFKKLVRRALPGGLELNEERLDCLVTEAKAWYGGHMMEDTRPYPGILEALAELERNEITLAVLTNKPDELCGQLIHHYFPEIKFSVVLGAREDKPLKPDPAVLLEMLAELGIPPQEASYVGDSDVDILTARNAKLTGLGAAWGFRGREELEAAGADIILDRPEELALRFWQAPAANHP